MSTGTLTDAEMDAHLSPEILALARRLTTRIAGQQLSPYRQQLLTRLRSRDQKSLPPFTYQSYRLMAGKHSHLTKEAIAEAHRLNKARPGQDLVNPEEKHFIPGDIITPQSDGEALLLDQDNLKYMPLGERPEIGGQEDAAALLAEVNRLKQLDANKDAKIAELEEAVKKAGKK